MSSCGGFAPCGRGGPLFFCGGAAPRYKPPPACIAAGTNDALHAGVAELVDALDLGSSDESCGGSSPSARTKRFQAFARRFSNLFPQGILVRQTTGARPF